MPIDPAILRLTGLLATDACVDCELGTFFPVIVPPSIGRNPFTGGNVPVPAKRLATFVPSDRFLRHACGELAVARSDVVADLARDTMGRFDLTTGARIYGDPDDENLPRIVPPSTGSIAFGALYDTIAQGIRAKRKHALSGLGTFRRFTVPVGALRGRAGVAFTPSPVLSTSIALRSAS